MREKYIEERFPRWFVFGTATDGSGRVFVNDGNSDVACASPEDAERLIADRDKIVDQLVKVAQAFAKAAPQEFKECWYGK